MIETLELMRGGIPRRADAKLAAGQIADLDPDVLYYELTPAWLEEAEPAP